MRGNWSDALEAAFQSLLAAAKDTGHVTYDQLENALPWKVFTSVEIEAVMTALTLAEIGVVDGDRGVGAA